MTFLPRKDVLTLEELDRLASAFVRLGARKIRLTGGEPLVRGGIVDLVRGLARHLSTGALRELTLTTNGARLARFADHLRAAGVRRVNVSLDSLDAARFQAITRHGKLEQVLLGLRAAREAGLQVKINTVALRGVNDDEHDDLVAWCGEKGFELTFIEVMPMGDLGDRDRAEQHMPLALVRRRLARRWTLRDIDEGSGGPARYALVAETGRRIGFIAPMTHNFCASCNRVRVACTGEMSMCLGRDEAADLRAPMRAGRDDGALERAIRAAIARKPRGHNFVIERGRTNVAVARHMSVTGG